jgi:putative tryptophan/tyrosine transport system substrate-binding protein
LGGAAVTSRPLRAQQRALPVIGYLNGTTPEANAPQLAAFRQGLSETGWVEGQNLAIEYRWAEFHYDRLPALAADLVDRKVDVLAACGGADEAFVAKDATSIIPIVFSTGADPVETGLVASLARPGGNLTGVTTLTQLLWQKRVELIAELVPQTRVIGVLVNPNRAQVGRVVDSTQQAVNAKGLQLEILKAGTEAEIDAAFATAVQRKIGAVVVSDPLFDSLAKQVAAAAARHAVSSGLYFAKIRVGRRLDQLWGDLHGLLSRGGQLRRQDPERRPPGRSAGPAIDQFRAGHQSHHGKGTRLNGAAADPCPRRRGHRVTLRDGATHT